MERVAKTATPTVGATNKRGSYLTIWKTRTRTPHNLPMLHGIPNEMLKKKNAKLKEEKKNNTPNVWHANKFIHFPTAKSHYMIKGHGGIVFIYECMCVVCALCFSFFVL